MQIKIKKLRDDAILPEYQTAEAAGFDFHVAINEPKTLQPGERFAAPTGLAMDVPTGYVLNIHARSGMSLKHGITAANGVGVIDADYRGEIMVLLANISNKEFTVEPKMRIAQGVIVKHETAEWQKVDDLSETSRGEGGFGSTGKS
ncbi:MAG: dUTP diphosphatase [Candidatus Nomurabacteria bacterium]|jgi:dUTP pyrophosphatase|nr:dUTP diphosphatase [Candidatus Nomurabacteria bacterium]